MSSVPDTETSLTGQPGHGGLISRLEVRSLPRSLGWGFSLGLGGAMVAREIPIFCFAGQPFWLPQGRKAAKNATGGQLGAVAASKRPSLAVGGFAAAHDQHKCAQVHPKRRPAAHPRLLGSIGQLTRRPARPAQASGAVCPLGRAMPWCAAAGDGHTGVHPWGTAAGSRRTRPGQKRGTVWHTRST